MGGVLKLPRFGRKTKGMKPFGDLAVDEYNIKIDVR
jgi:hypothetical protein